MVLLQVPVIGGSTFAIVNDDWTADVNNNGNYYISLNGQPSTGSIYSISTGVEAVTPSEAAMSLLPNPADASARLTVSVPTAADLSLELFDASGRAVMKTGYPAIVGTFRETLNPFHEGTRFRGAWTGRFRFCGRRSGRWSGFNPG